MGLHARTEPDAEEQTFAYADAIATHRAAIDDMLGRVDEPVVLTPWPMQIELRYPYLGYVDEPVRTLHPRSTPPDAAFDFILFATQSWRARELRRLAEERGLQRIGIYGHGVAQTMELYGR